VDWGYSDYMTGGLRNVCHSRVQVLDPSQEEADRKKSAIECGIGALERQFGPRHGLCRPPVRFTDHTESTDGLLNGHTIDFVNMDDQCYLATQPLR
jgi:hypothetical protein